jgi:hypothetical protein
MISCYYHAPLLKFIRWQSSLAKNVGHNMYFVLSVKHAHETYGLMEGGKFDFVLNCYLET